MVRALDDMRRKFHNRREWRDVVAAVQASVTVPDLVAVLKAGVQRLHDLEAAQSAPQPAP
jgi:hypothetical protein